MVQATETAVRTGGPAHINCTEPVADRQLKIIRACRNGADFPVSDTESLCTLHFIKRYGREAAGL